MEDLIAKARVYATAAHARINQLRKYTGHPYDVHLKGVAELVASVTGDEAMIAAAWLHDSVEDTPVTFEELESEFGADVMNLVKQLTDVSMPGDGNRAYRKLIDRQHTSQASPRAKTIKLADIIDNIEDICRHDRKFARVYLHEMKELLPMLEEGDSTLYTKAIKLMSDFDPGSDDAPSADLLHKGEPGGRRLKSGQHGIRLFTEAFTARDIQEPLISFDSETVKRLSSDIWRIVDTDLAGIRDKGTIAGYISRSDAVDGHPPRIRGVDGRQTVGLESPLTDVIHVLTHFTHCFVELDGNIVGFIHRSDIEKPVVRMWLFGFIILIEVEIVNLIRACWPDNSWTGLVSEGRMTKAFQLRDERLRRGFSADLLDCLQFSDKLQIIIHNPDFLEKIGFSSISTAKKGVKNLESLRNNLAHGQDITRHDWPQIVRLARRIQELYRW